MEIARIVERVLTQAPTGRGDSLEDIAEADRAARDSASELHYCPVRHCRTMANAHYATARRLCYASRVQVGGSDSSTDVGVWMDPSVGKGVWDK